MLFKECVAVSINICPWQDPLQFGIKVQGTPCGTPGRRWDVHYVQHLKLHHCSYISMSFLQQILVGFTHAKSTFVKKSIMKVHHMLEKGLDEPNVRIVRSG